MTSEEQQSSTLPSTSDAVTEERITKPMRTIIVPVERIGEESSEVEAAPKAEEEEVLEEEEDEEEEVPTVPVISRTAGVDVFTLPTLKDMYEGNGGKLEEVDESEEIYPYDEELNEKVVIWRGDITKLSVDAIVNAANKALLGGGGVDGAIHRAAGGGLYDECLTLHGAETGESKITGGHLLPSLHVIHTVGPIYSNSRKQESERLLRSCYRSTLELAVANNCKTLAFSGISTGIYGYPIDDATRVALDVTRKFLSTPEGAKLEKVIFTVFRQIDVDSYYFITPEYFPSSRHAAKKVLEEKEGEEEEDEEEVVEKRT